MKHAWILAAGLVATGLQPAWAQQAGNVRVPDTPAGISVGDTAAEAATMHASQRWHAWMGLSARILGQMTEARRNGDTAAFADLSRAYAEAMRNAGQAAQAAGSGRTLALRHVESAVNRHRAVLEGFLDRVPTDARVHIESSIIAADDSQDFVLAALGGEGSTVAATSINVTPDTPAVVTPTVVQPAGAVPSATDVTVVRPGDVEPTRPSSDQPATRRSRRAAPGTTPAVAVPTTPAVAVPVNPGVVAPGVATTPFVPVAPVVPGVNAPVVPGVNAGIVPGVNAPLVPGVTTPATPVPGATLGTPGLVPQVPGVNVPAVPGVNVPARPGVGVPTFRGGFSPNLPGASPRGAPAAPFAPAPATPGAAPR